MIKPSDLWLMLAIVLLTMIFMFGPPGRILSLLLWPAICLLFGGYCFMSGR